MFDSAPGVQDLVFQLYISMLEGLIVDRWSADKYLREISGIICTVKQFVFIHHDMGKCQWLDDRKMSHVSKNEKFIIFS